MYEDRAYFSVVYGVNILDLAVFARRSRRVSLGNVTADSWVSPSRERLGTRLVVSISDVRGQRLVFKPLTDCWSAVQTFWSRDNIFAKDLQMKFNAREFNVSRQSGITVISILETCKNCYHVTRIFEPQIGALFHGRLRWITGVQKRSTEH